jgi:hypothetical protein
LYYPQCDFGVILTAFLLQKLTPPKPYYSDTACASDIVQACGKSICGLKDISARCQVYHQISPFHSDTAAKVFADILPAFFYLSAVGSGFPFSLS